ncbi:tripartite motif-containing protein 16-like protein [Parambassis ranga]|uniref:Tripartite motif-containing protein 16-like protein n=1 Tax=Parambassis ranga TaxID=210632 RepID=A0A6P7IQF0_9TELE|nr:tripartite motif-containing protein 16-like protein [Parambassis ranga]
MAEYCFYVKTNHLSCRICSQVLRKPVTVPCGHNFCAHCIQRHWDQEQAANSTGLCSCAECGHTFSSRPQLIINTTLAEVVAEGREGRKRKLSESHVSGSSLCVTHSKPLDVYCRTDEQIICAQCTPDHIGHTIGWVSEERKRKQEELDNMQTQVTEILQKQREKCASMMKMLQQIEEEAKQIEDYCQGIIVGVIDALQRHYLTVKELIATQEEETAAQVHKSVHALQVRMEEMKKRDAELRCLAQTENNVYFLQKWLSVTPLCETDQVLFEGSEVPPLPFKLTKTAVEKLGRQLEDFCDKEFALISHTEVTPNDAAVLSHCTGEEPVTREQFLQYACELSLDPMTAHEDLVISDDDKEVKLCHPKCKNPHVSCPQRFLHRRQVLCREALQAERCYYEVEVEGDKAEIALAYKGINRKSLTKSSAFGGNAESWSLDRFTYYSVSHKDASIQLSTPPSHHRIGVYLQFKEGTLSFYEVSDTMKILYKMEAKFTEPLFPGFWLGDKCCIRICDLRL